MKKKLFLLIMLFIATINYSQDILINENFNGSTLPIDWRALASSDSGNGTQIWTFGSGVVPGEGNTNDFLTNAAIFDDDIAGSTGLHDRVWLWYRTPGAIGIDITPYNDVILEYEYALNVFSTSGETLTIGIWNGSDTFIPIRVYDTDTNPTFDSINITEAIISHPEIDPSAIFIGFGYDDNFSWGFGAGIDNVKLTGYNPQPNDVCTNAEIINANTVVNQTTYGATLNDIILVDCGSTGGGGSCPSTDVADGSAEHSRGVWYVYTSTSSETITISTEYPTTNYDTQLVVWSGSCTALDCIGSDDDVGSDLKSRICWLSTGTTLNPVDYYIHVSGFPDEVGDFTLSLDTDQSTASNQEFEDLKFSFYPNPAKNSLSVVSQEIITKISIFSLLGQEVKSIKPNTSNFNMDITNLDSGVYLLKANTNNSSSSKKLIKK